MYVFQLFLIILTFVFVLIYTKHEDFVYQLKNGEKVTIFSN